MTTFIRYKIYSGLYQNLTGSVWVIFETALFSETLENFIVGSSSPHSLSNFRHCSFNIFETQFCKSPALFSDPSINTAAFLGNCKQDLQVIFSQNFQNEWICPGVYQHYKKNYYAVLGPSKSLDGGDVAVLYRALYGDYGLWIRPLSMFQERGCFQEQIQPRFRKCSQKESTAILSTIRLP